MARPQSQADLLAAAEVQYSKLMSLISEMSDAGRAAPLYYGPDFAKPEAHWTRDKNLRDVIVHLTEWHQLLLGWVASNRADIAKPFLPAPYNWKTYGEMNEAFWRKHQETSLETALTLFAESHREVVDLISQFTDEELFTKAHFSWTGTTSLGSYCVSATSSHYDWAVRKLRRHLKAATQATTALAP